MDDQDVVDYQSFFIWYTHSRTYMHRSTHMYTHTRSHKFCFVGACLVIKEGHVALRVGKLLL